MIKVYFETDTIAILAATFEHVETYNACFKTLEAEAKRLGMYVTESVK